MTNKTTEGIVMKVTETHTVIMCEDGGFKNIPRSENEFPKIGERMSYRERKTMNLHSLKYISAVAVFLLAIVAYTIFQPGQPKAAYVVAIDINPSMEVYADENLNVIKLIARNDDGKKIINALKTDNQKLNGFIERVINETISQGFLQKDEKGLITTSVIPLQKDLQTINKKVETSITTSLQQSSVASEIVVGNSSKEMLEKAQQEELSVNAYKLYEKLHKKGVSLSTDEAKEKTITQLKAMAHKKVKDHPQEEKGKNKKSQKKNKNAKDHRNKHPNAANDRSDKKENQPGRSKGKNKKSQQNNGQDEKDRGHRGKSDHSNISDDNREETREHRKDVDKRIEAQEQGKSAEKNGQYQSRDEKYGNDKE